MSVSAWVAEMEDLEYNPVLVFKNQGDVQGENLQYWKGRFLTFQTEYQRDMMLQYDSNAICIKAVGVGEAGAARASPLFAPD